MEISINKAVGVLLKRLSGVPFQEAQEEWRKLIPDIKLEMPCGYVLIYPDFDSIPTEDTPCPCGDTGHWLVKYESWQEA